MNDAAIASRRQWGRWAWAGWVPELANAVIVAIPVLLAIAFVVDPYSDEEVRASIVDTYGVSSLDLFVAGAFASLGIAVALVTSVASRTRRRRRLAYLQVLLLLVAMGSLALQHHRLFERMGRVSKSSGGP